MNSACFGGVSGTTQLQASRGSHPGISPISILNLNSCDRRTRVYPFPDPDPLKEGIISRSDRLSVNFTHSNSVDLFSLFGKVS
jgi:hypothetical protein